MARDPNKLKVFGQADRDALVERLGELIRALQALITSLRDPKSEA